MLVFGGLALAFIRPRWPSAPVQGADGIGFVARLRRQQWSFLRSPLFLSVISAIMYYCLLAPFQLLSLTRPSDIR